MNATMTKRSTDGETLVRTAVPDLRRKTYAPSLVSREVTPSDNPRLAKNVPITSEHIDGDGDIIRADGLDVVTRYARNPIVMLQHGRTMEFPVIGGKAVLERAPVEGVPGWVAREFLFGDTVLGREINSLWNDMILNTTSIGFRPLEYFPIDGNGRRLDMEDPDALEQMTGFEFTKTLLFEFSVVAIPANPHAGRELESLLTGKAGAYFDLGALRKACAGCSAGPSTFTSTGWAPPKEVTGLMTSQTITFEPVKGVVGETVALTEPEPIARVAQLLKAVSLERCPGCKGVNLYSREAGSFLEHRSKAGPRCETKALAGEPCGPTVKTIADGIRERTRDETKLAKDAIPADAVALIEALSAVGDMKALAGWAGAVVKEVGVLLDKAGRVLSAETRRTIESQLSNIEAGIEAGTAAIEAMRGAARGLKDFLAAADRQDTEPDKGAATLDEAKASPAGGTTDAMLRDPQFLAALERVAAAV